MDRGRPVLIAAFLAAAIAPTPPSEASADAAVAVVRAYYAALGAHDYRAAYRLWHGTLSFPEFRRGYAHTRWTRVTPLPPVAVEGAAGSAFAEVRVRVDARLASGRYQHFSGSYTLRRVNDVDGSTAAQRRWHIVGARLRPVSTASLT